MSRSGKIRLAIVGLGRMGQLHWRTWQAMPEVDVIAVVDADQDKARTVLAGRQRLCRDISDLIGHIDMAVIASPSAQHAACALPLLQAGIHCLIEKPLALTISDCRALLAAAAAHRAYLAVGHCERFNPVLAQGYRRHPLHALRSIEVSRLATVERSLRADVVTDLMIHDLDWGLRLYGCAPDEIDIHQVQWQDGILAQVACALRFAQGPVLRLQASRISAVAERRLILDSGQGHTEEFRFDLGPAGAAKPQPDPLTRQAYAFLDLLRGQASPVATGQDALQAITLAERIRHACLKQAQSPLGAVT